LQGEFIGPTRGVLNCYDMDDFIHADVEPGATLVKQASSVSSFGSVEARVAAKFASWNQIHLEMDTSANVLQPQQLNDQGDRISVVLNQAFNPHWRAQGCNVLETKSGNLMLDCPVERLRQAPVEVLFFNKMSAWAASVSVEAWKLWSVGYAAMLCLWLLLKSREQRVSGVPIGHPVVALRRLLVGVPPANERKGSLEESG